MFACMGQRFEGSCHSYSCFVFGANLQHFCSLSCLAEGSSISARHLHSILTHEHVFEDDLRCA